MPRSTLLGLMPLVWLALLGPPQADPPLGLQTGRDARPNVLFMISDDQSFDTFSAAGHPLLKTPNIDSIATAGVRFTNAFVTTSVCSPAGASFLTGRYARNHGVINNSKPLPRDLPTCASVLQAGGYDTGYFGKWHMGTQGLRPGFETSFGYVGQGIYRNTSFYVNGSFEKVVEPGFLDDITTNHAIEWMAAKRDGPFLACVGFKATHGPREPEWRENELFVDATLPKPASLAARPPYPRSGELESLAEAADTVPRKFNAPANWAAGKLREANAGQAFAGEGMRVIALVHDPRGKLQAGPRDELVLNVDLAPTLIDLAGLDIPEGMDGRSLRPLLEDQALDGPEDAWRLDFLYEDYRNKRYPVPTLYAVRTSTAKLVRYRDYPEWEELYDLEQGPHELINLAGDPAHRAERDRLRERLGELEHALGPPGPGLRA